MPEPQDTVELCHSIADRLLSDGSPSGIVPGRILNKDPGIQTADVLAYCQLESSFNRFAFRDEPKIGDASYGLMQLLTRTAKDRGYTGDPTGLYDAETNIRYGILQLVWISDYLARRGVSGRNPLDIAASYNAGVGNFLHGFVPKTYVATWQTYRRDWQDRLNTVQS